MIDELPRDAKYEDAADAQSASAAAAAAAGASGDGTKPRFSGRNRQATIGRLMANTKASPRSPSKVCSRFFFLHVPFLLLSFEIRPFFAFLLCFLFFL